MIKKNKDKLKLVTLIMKRYLNMHYSTHMFDFIVRKC